MYSLRLRDDGTFYLTYDKGRRYTNSFRGDWHFIGPKDLSYTDYAVNLNRKNGLLCCEDDEGYVRVLVLE